MFEEKAEKLPDVLKFNNGTLVTSPEEFRKRRQEIYDLIINQEYGGLPPKPAEIWYENLHTAKAKHLNNAEFKSIRVIIDKDWKFYFTLYLLLPPDASPPYPVVLTGDGCWKYVTDKVAAEVLRRGYALAEFNRVEIAPDALSCDRASGIYRVYKDGKYGALSAWAWGYHRCIDVLEKMDFIDKNKIAITGHSRGGKTTLLAGATDERIAVTGSNNSGCGGAGCFHYEFEGAETLKDILGPVSYWFNPDLKQFTGRDNELPFDQHFLKSLIAPRPLLTTEARGDVWANPKGTYITYLAAKKVYKLFNAEDKIGIHYRDGGHNHGFEDWVTFLNFIDLHFFGKKCADNFSMIP